MPQMSGEQRAALQDALADLCEQAKRLVRDGSDYRATIVLRDTRTGRDGDVVVSEDEIPFILDAIERAGRRPR